MCNFDLFFKFNFNIECFWKNSRLLWLKLIAYNWKEAELYIEKIHIQSVYTHIVQCTHHDLSWLVYFCTIRTVTRPKQPMNPMKKSLFFLNWQLQIVFSRIDFISLNQFLNFTFSFIFFLTNWFEFHNTLSIKCSLCNNSRTEQLIQFSYFLDNIK